MFALLPLMALMKKHYFAALLMSACLVQPVYAADSYSNPMHEKELIERGGTLSRLRYRKEIRAYSYKIYTRQISYEELKDYLIKGGDPQVLSDYGPWNPFMSDTERPLLNYFIKGKNPFEPYFDPNAKTEVNARLREEFPVSDYEMDERPDRLRSLQLLLDNGAKPDLFLDAPASSFNDASPLLWASWLGDTDAMRLLINAGADINQLQTNLDYGPKAFGPPMLLAQSDAAMDIIFAHGPKLDIDVHDGNNIVQMLVTSVDYTFEPFLLRKLAWFQRHGIRFAWKSGSTFDPVKIAYERQRMYASDTYSSTNPYLAPGPVLAQRWGEIAKLLETLHAP